MEGTWSNAPNRPAPSVAAVAVPRATSRWLAATCAVVGVLTLLRLSFLSRSGLNLDFEEAQYWLWAQAAAWGYWSKPPMVAWLIAAATRMCGDGEPCVRLASPILHGVTALVLGALGRSLGGPALGFWAAVTYATLPGVALSSVLITTDVPLLLSWAVALFAFTRLLGSQRWPWAALCGLALGAGMLSKYSMLVFVPCAGIYLALSGRRVRSRHVLIVGGLAAALFAPNLAWNLAHQFGTVRHSLSRVRPGVSTFRPDEPVLFVLAQLAVFGPVLCACLLARLRSWRLPADDRGLLLASFTFPPLVLAVVVSIVARANPNWAAPAYVAGTVLVATALVSTGRARVLRASFALNLALGLALYAVLAAVPALVLPGGKRAPVGARLQGWDVLGRRVATHAAALQDARVLVDLRELLAVAAYYGAIPQDRLVEWNPSGTPHSQFQLRTRIAAGDPGPFLFVSYRPRPSGVTRRFASVELVERVAVPLAPGLERTHWLFVLRGFRGYRDRRAESAADPATRATAASARSPATVPANRSASLTPPSAVASVLCPGKTGSPTR